MFQRRFEVDAKKNEFRHRRSSRHVHRVDQRVSLSLSERFRRFALSTSRRFLHVHSKLFDAEISNRSLRNDVRRAEQFARVDRNRLSLRLRRARQTSDLLRTNADDLATRKSRRSVRFSPVDLVVSLVVAVLHVARSNFDLRLSEFRNASGFRNETLFIVFSEEKMSENIQRSASESESRRSICRD